MAAGTGAVQCALLFTDRRFAPTAFYQAALNVFTIIGRREPVEVPGRLRLRDRLYRGRLGAAGHRLFRRAFRAEEIRPPGLRASAGARFSTKPAFFVVYAAGLGLNITFTRAYATHAGPGMAAALDYCMRGVGVPLAILVNPDFQFAAAGDRPPAQPSTVCATPCG